MLKLEGTMVGRRVLKLRVSLSQTSLFYELAGIVLIHGVVILQHSTSKSRTITVMRQSTNNPVLGELLAPG